MIEGKNIIENVVTLVITGVFLFAGHRILDIGGTTESLNDSVIEIKTILKERSKIEKVNQDASIKIYSEEIHKLHKRINELEKEVLDDKKKPKGFKSLPEDKINKEDYEKSLRGRLHLEQQQIQQTLKEMGR